jgi:NitT/TauT family transport system permease protein
MRIDETGTIEFRAGRAGMVGMARRARKLIDSIALSMADQGIWHVIALQVTRVAVVAIIFVGWELLAAHGLISSEFIGRPTLILKQLVAVIKDGSLLQHTSITVGETLLGFTLGIAVGLACGLLLWWSDFAARVLDPFIVLFNSTPRIVFAPALIIIIGIGFETKVLLSFLNVFAVAWMNIYQGTRSVDTDLIRLLRAMGASKWQIFVRVVVPTSLPWLISTLKLCIGFALVGAIVGEYVAARSGLGYLIFYASSIYEMNLVWAGVLALMAVSLVLYVVIARVERRLLRWMNP